MRSTTHPAWAVVIYRLMRRKGSRGVKSGNRCLRRSSRGRFFPSPCRFFTGPPQSALKGSVPGRLQGMRRVLLVDARRRAGTRLSPAPGALARGEFPGPAGRVGKDFQDVRTMIDGIGFMAGAE